MPVGSGATLKQINAHRFWQAKAALLDLRNRPAPWTETERLAYIVASVVFHSHKQFVPRRCWSLPRPSASGRKNA